MTALVIRPVSRKIQREGVARWHSHHKPTLGETLALGAHVDAVMVAVVVMGVPVGPGLQDGTTWEVARLAIGPDAPRFAASRLLGAAGRTMDAAGINRQVSYTRIDEAGTCYLASGWVPMAIAVGRTQDGATGAAGGNRATFLPGMWNHSTETVDRVRWERGARVRGALASEARSRGVDVRAIVDERIAAFREARAAHLASRRAA